MARKFKDNDEQAQLKAMLSVAFDLTLERLYKTSLDEVKSKNRMTERVKLRKMFAVFVRKHHPDLPLRIVQEILNFKQHGTLLHHIAMHEIELGYNKFYVKEWAMFEHKMVYFSDPKYNLSRLQYFASMRDFYNLQYENQLARMNDEKVTV